MSHPASDDSDLSTGIITLKGIRIEFKKKPKKGSRTLQAVFNGVPVSLVDSASTDGLSRHWTLDPEIHLLPNFDDNLQFAYGDVGKGKDFFSLFKRQPEGFNVLMYDEIANEFRKGQKPTAISIPRRKWTVTLEVAEGHLDHVIPKGSFNSKELDPLLNVEDVISSGTSYSKSMESIRKTLESISDLDITNGLIVLQSARRDTTASPIATALVTGLLIPFELLSTESKYQQELQAVAKAMLSASRCIVNIGKHSKVTSAKGQFGSVSKLLRDAALFVKIYEIKRESGQSVGSHFSARLVKYRIELDDARKILVSATTDDGGDVSRHLVVDKCINVQFKDGKKSTSLELLFNGDIIPMKNSASHEWTLPCDISMLPNWDDTITIHGNVNSKDAMTRLDYNAIADMFRTQRSESKAKGEVRAHEALSFEAASFTVTLKVATGSITDFLTIEHPVSDPLLPESAYEAITWVNSNLEDAQKLGSVMENIPITEDILQVLESTFDTLANAHPLAKAVLTLLSIPYNLMKNEQSFKKNVNDLTDAMVTTCKCLTDVRYHVKITSAKDLFASIMKTLRDAVLFVSIYLGRGRFGQFVGAQFPNRLTKYADDLIKQKNDFQLAVILQIAREVDKLSDLTVDDYLKKRLDPVKGAPLGEGCLEDTRVNILKEVMDWVYDCDSEMNILWITGAPGAGKSTIVTTIAKELAERSPFCSKFFCKHDDPNLRDPRQIWRALAYGLTGKHSGVRAALMHALDQRKGDPRDYLVVEQFQKLIKEPLEINFKETYRLSHTSSCPVLIIDALDECYSADDRNWDSLLDSLKLWSELSQRQVGTVKLVITGRHRDDLHSTLDRISRRIVLSTGDDISVESNDDIEIFFDKKFSAISARDDFRGFGLPPNWPGRSTIKTMTVCAAGLFIWADMVVNYLAPRGGGFDPVQRLQAVLNDIETHTGIDGAVQVDRLYARIILEAFRHSIAFERMRAKSVLATVVLAIEPLRIGDVAKLQSTDVWNARNATESTLRMLSPIIPVHDAHEELRVCHATVSDFLLSQDRSKVAMEHVVQQWNRRKPEDQISDTHTFIIDRKGEEKKLALACLLLVHRELSNDISNPERVLEQSGESLDYACHHWCEHLDSAGDESIEDLKRLAHAMEIAYECLKRHRGIVTSVQEEAVSLTDRLRRAADVACQYIEHKQPMDTREQIYDGAKELDFARGKFQIAVVEKSTSEPADLFLRKQLQPADQTVLDDPCLEGTRTNILLQAKQWLESEDPKGKNILWIAGGPGAGKSAIATSLVNEFCKSGLCAKFFAKRDYNDRRDPARVWRTLVYGLANLHVGLKGSIMEALYEGSKRPENLEEEQSQFRDLLVKALQDLHCLSGVFVIDALDECFSEEDNEQWKAFIQTLAGWAELPLRLKLVVTSRDIPEIRSSLENVSHTISLAGSSDEANRDIKIFLRTKLTNSVTEEEIEELTEHGCGSFIWARMVAGLVTKVGSAGLVKDVLANGGHGGDVDVLYGKILWDTLGQLLPMERLVTRSMLATMVLAKDPLRKSDLEVLATSNASSVHQAHVLVDRLIKELSSIISVDDNQKLRIPHKSFADFLLDRDRCASALKDVLPAVEDIHSYLVNREEDSARAAITCLQSMNETLIFNLCGIETSHFLNKDIPDLQDRISKNVDSSLIYACRFWAEHLNDCSGDIERFRGEVEPLLETLLRKNLFYWFEILSLTNAVPCAKSSLKVAEDFLVVHNSELAGIAKDAQLFVEMFETPISASPPHIYLSALPCCPSESWIARIYGPQYPSVLSVVKGRQVNWGNPVTGDDAHTGGVNAVAFFPLGGKLASGSDDRTVRIWDARTGHALAAPFIHESWVQCVAVSRDGGKIASGDGEGVLRIWDSDTGACPLGSIKAHSGSISSVVFSPDGSRIVTGSYDRTVKVWNTVTGELCLGPLARHTNDVRSVAFSIDGTAIASGSKDKTICIWDAHTGAPRIEPLTEHANWVWCVAFSPDGRYFASGSWDKTIRLWDVAQGFSQTSTTPVEDDCTTLSFSPDSNTLVSGVGMPSRQLHFWSVRCGNLEQIGRPIYGHIDTIRSVSFAPDGLSVASCSTDGSIKVWTVPGPSAPNLPPASAESLDAHERPVLSDESFIDNEGWMRSSRRDDAKVLFWVPRKNRECFWWPRNTVVIHSNVTKLDFRRFVHGEHWAECRRTSADSEAV